MLSVHLWLQCWGDADKWIPGVHLPDSMAYCASPRAIGYLVFITRLFLEDGTLGWDVCPTYNYIHMCTDTNIPPLQKHPQPLTNVLGIWWPEHLFVVECPQDCWQTVLKYPKLRCQEIFPPKCNKKEPEPSKDSISVQFITLWFWHPSMGFSGWFQGEMLRRLGPPWFENKKVSLCPMNILSPSQIFLRNFLKSTR